MATVNPCCLVVEDDPHLQRLLRTSLSASGYQIVATDTAKEALHLAASHHPDVVLLDLGLPDADGLEVTRVLRQTSTVPIIVISARGKDEDKVTALDLGADDYLTKPFSISELLARIRVALRHAHRAADASIKYEFGQLKIDVARRLVTVDAQERHLTPTEYKLLVLLARYAGKVMTHRQILKSIWGLHNNEHAHYVRVHMAELRKKIESDPARPQYIITEPGVGYRLRSSE